MSYHVLARKWRPKTFKQMIGQETILRMISNALDQQRLHHAYLFTGTRGVGKTSIARIIAKCLNCEVGISATPCDTCPSCENIAQGKFIDLYEIDAASRTKVEDTKELLENILYPPQKGRFKIYLIDEVHMLSHHSFNALLKTLEEPPSHIKFLLATTDPQKLPVTILSRCLQFHLKRVTPEHIAEHLAVICQAENVVYENQALVHLAKAANGSIRDALSLLDQALVYEQGTLKTAHIETMLGCIAQTALTPLLQALAARNGKQLFMAIQDLATRVPDFSQLLEELIHLFHQLAIAQIVPEYASMEMQHQDMLHQFTPEEIQIYYQIALLSKRDLGLASSPEQGFTMAMLRMLAFKPHLSSTQGSILQETASSGMSAMEDAVELLTPPHANHPLEAALAPTLAAAEPLPDWKDILAKLGLTGMAYALASNCILLNLKDNHVELGIAPNHQPMLNVKLKERLKEALSVYFQKNINLDIRVSHEPLNTPIKQKTEAEKIKLETAKARLSEDPIVKHLLETYDSTLEVSLRPSEL